MPVLINTVLYFLIFFQEIVEPQELQGSRQPSRDVAGRRLVLQEKVSDHATGSNEI